MSFRPGRFVTITLTVLLVSAAAGPTAARPQYAAREGMYCTSCHVDPAGGGMRHGNGFAYARGRHSWDVEPKFEEWKVDPEITKGVRVGGDIRYAGMAYDESRHYDDDFETSPTFGNFAMQGSAYLALNPVEPVLLYYNHDLGATNQKARDWWGMVRNLTDLNIYVKAGQIRPAYGLRLEDHTPFVKGFEAPVPGEVGIMDIDPRFSYPGVEAGFVKNGVFLHAGYADPEGTDTPNFVKLKEKMVSGKSGVQKGHWQLGGSFRTNGRGDGDPDTRASRYGLFGLYGQKNFAIVAEADAGKDEDDADKDNLRAGYLEGEVYLSRGVTARAELNYMDVEDDATGALSLVSRRWGVGFEWNPIPFVRLAAEGRYVSNSTADRNPATRDETWGLGYALVSF